MKKLLVLLTLLPSAAFAGKAAQVNAELVQISIQESQCLDSEDAISTVGMKACLWARAEQLDVVLNREYKAIRALVEGEEEDRLVQSQRDWLKFRESNCSWQASQMLGGTGEGVIFQGCSNKMTDERIKELVGQYYFEEQQH